MISSDSRTTADDLRRNPRTRTISAVREGRIVVVPAEQLQPGPETGDGVRSLARALHGDAAG